MDELEYHHGRVREVLAGLHKEWDLRELRHLEWSGRGNEYKVSVSVPLAVEVMNLLALYEGRLRWLAQPRGDEAKPEQIREDKVHDGAGMSWLAALRGERSQYQMARKIGIPQSTYASIECGARKPSVPMAKRIAGAMGFEWTKFFEEEA